MRLFIMHVFCSRRQQGYTSWLLVWLDLSWQSDQSILVGRNDLKSIGLWYRTNMHYVLDYMASTVLNYFGWDVRPSVNLGIKLAWNLCSSGLESKYFALQPAWSRTKSWGHRFSWLNIRTTLEPSLASKFSLDIFRPFDYSPMRPTWLV